MIMPSQSSESSHSIPPTHSSLPRRLADPEDSKTWAEFYRVYRKLVFGFATRAGLSSSDAEEVTQDVFNEVSTNVHSFLGNLHRGSFRGWLLNLSRWRVVDKIRQRQRHDRYRAKRDGNTEHDHTDTIEAIPDMSAPADSIWEDEWERQVLDVALLNLRDRVDARHFQAFELHVAHGLPASTIARQLDLNPATVYVIHFRLKKQLKAEVMRLKTRVN